MNEHLDRDRATLEAIGRIYCGSHHTGAPKDAAGLCPECREAVDFTLERTNNCPHGHDINCQDCDIKCQRGDNKDRIKEIMRYSAPRMLVRHPVMTMEYLAKKMRRR